MAKELTVREMASMGGRARAKAHSKTEIRAWGKPALFRAKAVARLQRLLRAGKSKAQRATILGVSVRTKQGALATQPWPGPSELDRKGRRTYGFRVQLKLKSEIPVKLSRA
jgi:hypothetical protein